MGYSRIGRAVGAALALSIAPLAAQAVIVEDTAEDGLIGDAGSTFATAMFAGGTEVTGISGFLGEGGNDLFRFDFLVPVLFQVTDLLPDVKGNFDYDVIDMGFGPESAPIDYCFDCFIDHSGVGGDPFGVLSLAPGTYYLGIADIDEFPESLAIGAYSMNITITSLASEVPLPGALALLAGGLAALGAARGRRRAG